MIDIKQHKEYLWKYTLIYGKLKKSHNDPTKYVFPFFDISLENDETINTYHTEKIKNKLDACTTIEEIYNAISFEYKDFYFMEISSLLHDDIELYSKLLKTTFDLRSSSDYITKKNYIFMANFADSETKAYIESNL